MSNQEQKKPSMEEALGSRMKPLEEHQAKIEARKTGKMPEIILAEEQTEDEIVEQALVEASAETGMLSQEPPQVVPIAKQARKKIEAASEERTQSAKSLSPAETLPVQPKTMTSTGSPLKKEQPIIPALNIDRLHATDASTPESPDPPTEEKIKRMPDHHDIKCADQPDPPITQVEPDEILGRGEDKELTRLVDYVHSGEYSAAWVQLHISSISSFPSVLPTPTLWDIPNDMDIAGLVYQVVLTAGFVENNWPHLRLIMGSSRDNVDWSAAVLTTFALFQAIQLLPFAIRGRTFGAD